MTTYSEIIHYLPYTKPFLFVDSIERVDEEGIIGRYTMREDEVFYTGHFPGYPVTPGVILTEVCAQIGLVCLGLFLERDQLGKSTRNDGLLFLLTSSEMNFLLPVYPGDTVKVDAEKIYYRLGKLKVRVIMHNQDGKEVCRGEIAGMKAKKDHE
jgi:3-hydroxyacyl-[acyl-carrier-protein] dehydratase